ncbi:DUF2726 domain-containing protein [Prosthecobacter sp.]|uniref:DUF2726 domain-containing protein n=1 Tax=Prosthecobacter sp. TaxID=1965333 RepID=UPI001D7DAF5C|nr:DUF2726 domain-containing protein [Prosthecobacter sp.]MCB1278537.1 DUF2726 domain-containing protein [Prosthecobacter sp.]
MQPTPQAPDNAPARPISQPLLTRSESLFLACLENLSHQRCHIQCKPRLTDFLHDEALAGFQKICQRHIDFFIYRKEDWLPMLAIEFEDDDNSAEKSSRRMRDRKLVNDVLQSTGVPLVHVHAKEIDQIDTLVHKLTAAWHQRAAALET